jgi:hypothetical protein
MRKKDKPDRWMTSPVLRQTDIDAILAAGEGKIAYPTTNNLTCAAIGTRESKSFWVENIKLHSLFSPDHNDCHHA